MTTTSADLNMPVEPVDVKDKKGGSKPVKSGGTKGGGRGK